MVPAHFHDVGGDLSDHNVGKIVWIVQLFLELSCHIVFYSHFDRYYSQFACAFRAGFLNMSKTTRAFTSLPAVN